MVLFDADFSKDLRYDRFLVLFAADFSRGSGCMRFGAICRCLFQKV